MSAQAVNIFVVVRAVIYAAVFIGFVLVYLPARFLSWSGIVAPESTGALQVAGIIMVTIGTAIALWCVVTFVFIGKGTPAPFDPPRKLVVTTNRHEFSDGRLTTDYTDGTDSNQGAWGYRTMLQNVPTWFVRQRRADGAGKIQSY